MIEGVPFMKLEFEPTVQHPTGDQGHWGRVWTPNEFRQRHSGRCRRRFRYQNASRPAVDAATVAVLFGFRSGLVATARSEIAG
jgi:hypothetical protein